MQRNLLDADGQWNFLWQKCSECNRLIVQLIHVPNNVDVAKYLLVYPSAVARKPLPKYIDPGFTSNYKEACNTLHISSKASAALSRRLLQNILREKADIRVFNSESKNLETKKIKQGDLYDEIQQVLDFGGLPSVISSGLDAVRAIGNFASHPIKSKSTGEIVDVEPGEADWNLDVIESLFDYYFIQPHELELKRKAINKKMKDAGKPEIR